MSWKKSLGVVLFCGIAPIAMSAPVNFSFAENNDLTTGALSFVGSNGHSTVNVSAYASSGTPLIGSSSVAGLHILTCTDGDSDCVMEDATEQFGGYGYQIDGYGAQEAAVLDFGRMVNLVSATFTYTEANDDFTLLAGGMGGAVVLADQHPGVGLFATFNFGADVSGEQFAFLADHWSDDFKLYSVTADFVSNVPEPASLSLLGLGLMALGTVRKKK